MLIMNALGLPSTQQAADFKAVFGVTVRLQELPFMQRGKEMVYGTCIHPFDAAHRRAGR